MATQVNKTQASQLKRIKRNVDRGLQYFDSNIRRFNDFRRFVFQSSLTKEDIDSLTDMQKPILEFNMMESYIDRLLGEFVKHEPSMEVEPSHDQPIPIDIQTVSFVEGLLRAILSESKRNGHTQEVYKDLMSGGFSIFELYTDYERDKTFNQKFYLKRAPDPTLIGFDPMAQESHKADGDFCYKVYPRRLEEAERDYPNLSLKDMTFTRNFGAYSWSYKNEKNEKILLLVEYYEKKKKTTKIHQLQNGMVLTDKQYDELLETWKQRNLFALPPIPVQSRDTTIITIVRYTLIENQVLEYEETDYPFFPFIFVDGKSVMLKDQNGPVQQMTRPIVYHAKDTQRLKNFAGQTLANELENMIQHRLMAAKESIPAEYKNAYQDFQHADVVVYNAYADNNAEKPLPPPSIVPRVNIPPEVTNTFAMADQAAQTILGSFDLSMGKLNNMELSGIAIQESLTASNANAMPVINGYLIALNHVLQMIVEMIPKYYTTKRTVPILDKDGKRVFQRINDPDDPKSVPIDYYSNALMVNVEAGVNFSIQKARTIQQVVALSQSMPIFGQFMNEKGLRILVDNLELHGGDQLKMLADAFMQELQQKQMMQQHMAMNPPPNPMIALKQQELQLKDKQMQLDAQIKTGDLVNDAQALANEQTKMQLEARENNIDNLVQIQKANAEVRKAALDSTLDIHNSALKEQAQTHKHTLETSKHMLDATNQMHQHAKDAINLQQQANQASQANNNQMGA